MDRRQPPVSCVLTATRTPGGPTKNAKAGKPPWFGPEQRTQIAALLSGS